MQSVKIRNIETNRIIEYWLPKDQETIKHLLKDKNFELIEESISEEKRQEVKDKIVELKQPAPKPQDKFLKGKKASKG